MTDGERPEWSSSGGNLSVLQTRGTMACLIISAGTVGVWVGQSFQTLIWLSSSQKTIFSCSLSEEKTEWAWRSCGILSERKQPPLAAFYPHRRSSRGGLSFGSTVGQNGEPSAFSCRDNTQSAAQGKGRRERWNGRWGYGEGLWCVPERLMGLAGDQLHFQLFYNFYTNTGSCMQFFFKQVYPLKKATAIGRVWMRSETSCLSHLCWELYAQYRLYSWHRSGIAMEVSDSVSWLLFTFNSVPISNSALTEQCSTTAWTERYRKWFTCQRPHMKTCHSIAAKGRRVSITADQCWSP